MDDEHRVRPCCHRPTARLISSLSPSQLPVTTTWHPPSLANVSCLLLLVVVIVERQVTLLLHQEIMGCHVNNRTTHSLISLLSCAIGQFRLVIHFRSIEWRWMSFFLCRTNLLRVGQSPLSYCTRPVLNILYSIIRIIFAQNRTNLCQLPSFPIICTIFF